MLDYNIQRLEVDDRRGLEMLILMAVCTLLDAEYDDKYKDGPSGNVYLSGYNPSLLAPAPHIRSTSAINGGEIKAEPNELYIDMYSPNEAVVQRALTLLRQDEGGEGLHLIILKAQNAQVTPKAVQIAADIKARWYRLEPLAKGRTLDPIPGSQTDTAEELYQYVRDPSLQKSQAATYPIGQADLNNDMPTNSNRRPRIKLDPPNKEDQSSLPAKSPSNSPSKTQKASYLPPPNQLDIYLSKEKLDEFEVSANIPSNNAHSHLRTQRPLMTPSIPPKKQHFVEEVSHETTTKKKILGKLGLRKGQVNG